MRVFIAYNLCCGGLLSLLDDGLALDRTLLLLGRALENNNKTHVILGNESFFKGLFAGEP